MTALATAEDLATYLNQSVSTAHADFVLELASDAVRQAAGQQIDFGRDTFALQPNGAYLILPQRPVVVDADNPIVVEGHSANTWRLNSDRTALTLVCGNYSAINVGRLWWPEQVTITYSHGYQPGSVPASLKQVVLEAAKRHLSNPDGFDTYTVGGLSVRWQTGQQATGLLTERERTLVRRFFGGSQGMLTIA